LLTALRDLDQGIVHPMLEPKAFQNRKPASIHRKFLKSYVVHCTDRLHAAGMSIDEACRFVALEMKNLGFKFPKPSKTDQQAIRGWRAARSRNEHVFAKEPTSLTCSLRELKARTKEGLADAFRLLGDVA